MNLEVLTPILAGAALSAPYLLLARAWPAAAPRIYAIGLVVAAGIYGVLAVVAGDFGALPLEIGGLLVFTLVAVAGLRWWQPLLALGWAAHVAWDMALHPLASGGYAPSWYPLLCVGFDLVVAGWIAASPGGRERRDRSAMR